MNILLLGSLISDLIPMGLVVVFQSYTSGLPNGTSNMKQIKEAK